MKNTDRQVEKVLHGLRDAEPDALLETRVLRALRAAEPEVKAAWFSAWRFGLRGTVRPGAVAVCAMAVCLAAVAVLFSAHRGPAPSRGGMMSTKATMPRMSTAVARAVPMAMPVKPQQPQRDARASAVAVEAREADGLSREEAGSAESLLESSQESFPAPPLPLTEQERLLVRLKHRDDPVQLAQLSPVARAARLEEEKEEVRVFFTPPALPDMNVMDSVGGTE